MAEAMKNSGLIHADLHFYNVINNNGVNQITDFDDSRLWILYVCNGHVHLVTYSEKSY